MKTIALSGKKGAGRVALVDDEDFPLVEGYRWRLFEYPSARGHRLHGPYAITWILRADGRRSSLLMHSAITSWRLTDHIDHDGLNNQRSNLREATSSQNQGNRRSTIGSTSRYKGVFWSRQGQRWIAQIYLNGAKRHLGSFTGEEEAALAYNAAALEAFGSYACLNQIEAGAA